MSCSSCMRVDRTVSGRELAVFPRTGRRQREDHSGGQRRTVARHSSGRAVGDPRRRDAQRFCWRSCRWPTNACRAARAEQPLRAGAPAGLLDRSGCPEEQIAEDDVFNALSLDAGACFRKSGFVSFIGARVWKFSQMDERQSKRGCLLRQQNRSHAMHRACLHSIRLSPLLLSLGKCHPLFGRRFCHASPPTCATCIRSRTSDDASSATSSETKSGFGGAPHPRSAAASSTFRE